MGGEKSLTTQIRQQEEGSPPRGRGKDSLMNGDSAMNGITPAWAGKRHFRNSGFKRHGDHPRVGGEKMFERPG